MKIRPPLHVCLNNSVALSPFMRETCKGGQFSCVLAALVSSNLNTLISDNKSFIEKYEGRISNTGAKYASS